MTKPAKTAADRTDPAKGPWIEIFVAGTHTDSSGTKLTFTEAHLDEIVASYDPAVHEAPIVVGHPKTDDPALGWLSALKREGKRLYGQESQVAPEFEEMRAAGQYKKRSASFYLPTSPGNPTPGKMHIRHVGWLGAMPPAIKGMADKAKTAAFSEDDGAGVVEFNDVADFADDYRTTWGFRALAELLGRLRDNKIETDGVEAADRIFPRYEIDSLREAGLRPESSSDPAFGEGTEPDVTDPNALDDPAQLRAERESTVPTPSPEELLAMTQTAEQLAADQKKLDDDRTALAADKVAFAEQQKQLDDQRAAAARKDATDYADALVAGGKLAPSARNGVVELLMIAGAAPALNFSDSDGADPTEKPASQVLRGILDGMPQQFDFSEKSAEKSTGLNLSDPTAVAAAAVSFAESEKKAGREISIAAAVKHVSKGAK